MEYFNLLIMVQIYLLGSFEKNIVGSSIIFSMLYSGFLAWQDSVLGQYIPQHAVQSSFQCLCS